MKVFWRTYKIEASIFFSALVLRLIMFFALLAISSPDGFSLPLAGSDSTSYLDAARELGSTGRFFDRHAGLPNSYEVPGYPLFLAFVEKLGGGPLLAALLQNVIAAASAVIVYKIGSLLAPAVGMLAAVLFAVDPAGVFYSNFILTETLFIFFVLAAAYFLFGSPTSIIGGRKLFASGILLGAATMVRPVGEILLPGFVAVLGVLHFREWRKVAALSLAVILGFLAVAGPWFLRNKILFDRWELSSVASLQFAFAHAPLFYAHKNSVPAREAINVFHEKLLAISPYGDETTLRNSPYMWRIAFEYLGEDPVGFAKFHAIKTIPFFLSDGWREMAARADLIPNSMPSLGDLAMKKDFAGLQGALQKNKTALLLFLGGAAFWLAVNLFMLLGMAFGLRTRVERAALLLLSAFIVFATALVAGGAVSHPRYRMSVSPFMFILASFGFLRTVAFLKSRWLNRGVGKTI